MHRELLVAAEIDAYIGYYHHTGHCEDILTRQETGGGGGLTMIRRKYVITETSC
jgi:hypothetical protein